MTDPTIAAVGFAHPHVVLMTRGLLPYGITCPWVWDEDPQLCQALHEKIPGSRKARGLAEILEDPHVRLVCSAVEPRLRAQMGQQFLKAGKDVLMAKPGLISREDLEAVRKTIRDTGRRFLVFFSERFTSPETFLAETLVRQGALGYVVHHLGLGPHLLGGARPAWFFSRTASGGIINDLGSHQVDQFLTFTGTMDAAVTYASVQASQRQDVPGPFQDLGEACLRTSGAQTGYFRVDWHSPAGFPAYGDSRTLLTGTAGSLEIRRTIDPFQDPPGAVLILTDAKGQRRFTGRDLAPHPFYAHLVRDLREGTVSALDQDHVLRVLDLCLTAQDLADHHPQVPKCP